MDKRLLDQVQQALKAQQDTIRRQEQMLDDQKRYTAQMLEKKDQDIAQLTESLNKLAQTKTQELERLPRLFRQLQDTMTEQTSVFNGWMEHRKHHVKTITSLINEFFILGNAQIQLVEQLKMYQGTITPPDYLESDTTQVENDTAKLESEWKELASTQSKIEQSQARIIVSQEKWRTELRILDELSKNQEK
ncbi:hypothetical protein ACTXMK_14480 [Psychrobacter celer]|uniref:hypothetical protein n=1 Tax=Psychrobacter celer TaxID=306572 RepID=UPI003FD3248E